MGRDLIMQPPQEDGPVNALAKMYVEIDGKQLRIGRASSPTPRRRKSQRRSFVGGQLRTTIARIVE